MTCYTALLGLCDALEAVADDLPKVPQSSRCRLLAFQIEDLLAAAHHEEEQLLLPMLAQSDRPELRQMASRLRREHDTDNQSALELRDTLLDLARHQFPRSPDAIGYMLRSFFESLRRHVEAEQDIIALLRQIPVRPGALH
ncbi:MAG: hypothetical protein ABS75_03475 [Pelagibacterium sp. SCN 63-23]|nr:MAG: hypothetical protein ABS75_03475 [Pelagibacterium sp. SCN 63-23]